MCVYIYIYIYLYIYIYIYAAKTVIYLAAKSSKLLQDVYFVKSVTFFYYNFWFLIFNIFFMHTLSNIMLSLALFCCNNVNVFWFWSNWYVFVTVCFPILRHLFCLRLFLLFLQTSPTIVECCCKGLHWSVYQYLHPALRPPMN